ncbi:hypothetical protein C2845_PM11G02240 [Panicum miliaceum]|uniref:Uncharacterized protein n=1 Tax=Panicum miliaceum TaxID=4540 RepID=A0A3L6RMC8_PANMI|nr:hypothetical protein C2845_PM11G02240 [Panicum miliaceum]
MEVSSSLFHRRSRLSGAALLSPPPPPPTSSIMPLPAPPPSLRASSVPPVAPLPVLSDNKRRHRHREGWAQRAEGTVGRALAMAAAGGGSADPRAPRSHPRRDVGEVGEGRRIGGWESTEESGDGAQARAAGNLAAGFTALASEHRVSIPDPRRSQQKPSGSKQPRKRSCKAGQNINKRRKDVPNDNKG